MRGRAWTAPRPQKPASCRGYRTTSRLRAAAARIIGRRWRLRARAVARTAATTARRPLLLLQALARRSHHLAIELLLRGLLLLVGEHVAALVQAAISGLCGRDARDHLV